MKKFIWHRRRKPTLVELTRESAEEINLSKRILLVPGDMITPGSPLMTASADSIGYTAMNFLVIANNLSNEEVKFCVKGIIGPIGNLSEFAMIDDNWRIKPKGQFSWTTSRPVFGSMFRVEFSVEASPESQVDVVSELVLTKSSTSTV